MDEVIPRDGWKTERRKTAVADQVTWLLKSIVLYLINDGKLLHLWIHVLS